MLYHVHHLLNGKDRVRGSFVWFETAREAALGLLNYEGGQAYITQASVVQWDSRARLGPDEWRTS